MSIIKTFAYSIYCVIAMASCKGIGPGPAQKSGDANSKGSIRSAKPEGGISMNQAVLSALTGDPREANLLAMGEVPGSLIPSQYFYVISAQNEGNNDLFATVLYWSGNPFNKIRSMYWFKNMAVNLREVALWGGLVSEDGGPFQPELRRHWKDILEEHVQINLIDSAISNMGTTTGERKILISHALKAILGSGGDAKAIWKYYYPSIDNDLSMESRVGMDWLALSRLELQGFPGPRITDKCLYWLLIAAENGDSESQFRVANLFNTNDYASRARQEFWLKKASDGGWTDAGKQLRTMGQ
jgi:hypothetical protein